jgi:hypothetical protein
MRFRTILIAPLLALIFFGGLSPQVTGQATKLRLTAGIAPSPVVQEMLDQIDVDGVSRLVAELSGEQPVTIGGEPYTIRTRNSFSGEPVRKAAQYLYEYYQGLDLDVAYQDFDLFGTPLVNVTAEKKGSLTPEQVYLITSHYDDAPGGPRAPGADDNASGTAAVMLAAKILPQYDFGCTLRFVNFSGEEQGLVGSAQYAKDAYCAREDLRAVLNLDMIAWNTAGSPPQMELHAQPGVPGSLEIARLFTDVIDAYDLNLLPELISPGIGASDHASFWRYDYPAILAIEDLEDFNPNYHTPDDDMDNLEDLAYYTGMVKGSLATLAHLGCLVEGGWGTVVGTVTEASTGMPLAGAWVTVKEPGRGFTRFATTAQDGSYNLEVPAGTLLFIADANGYSATKEVEITVSQGQTTAMDVQLTPLSESLNYIPLLSKRTTLYPPDCP